MRIGFIVNPVAGMGGSVGLKGTDGSLYYEALRRGARPVAPERALRFLKELKRRHFHGVIISANHSMGCDYVREVGLHHECIDIPAAKGLTRREDTMAAARKILSSGIDLLTFVGGDGTARDIVEAVDGDVPILGIPAGVKMYSGVFSLSPEAAALIVRGFEEGVTAIEVGEVADADEESIRKGILRVRRFALARTPVIEGLLVPTKDFGSGGDEEEKVGIAQYFIEEYLRPQSLYLLGPGTTIKAITDVLGLRKTLLGVDALYNGRIVGTDLGEKEILELIEKFDDPHIVVTVIGAQGYIFGRGNQQFSSAVIRHVGKKRIHVLATESKLRGLKYLLVDSGDPELDKELAGHIRVITGYREETVMSVVPACCPENYVKTTSSRLPSS